MGAACEPFDRALLAAAGQPSEVNVVASAVVRNGSVPAAMANARRYFGQRLGLEVHQVPLLRRSDASQPAIVNALAGSPLTYLLGGDPGYLLDTLLESPAWDAILKPLGGGARLPAAARARWSPARRSCSEAPTPARRPAMAARPPADAAGGPDPHLNNFGEGWLAAARRRRGAVTSSGWMKSTGMVYAGGMVGPWTRTGQAVATGRGAPEGLPGWGPSAVARAKAVTEADV